MMRHLRAPFHTRLFLSLRRLCLMIGPPFVISLFFSLVIILCVVLTYTR